MTTSLPTTPSSEILASAAGALAGNASLADGLAALLAAAPASGTTPAGTSASAPAFTVLLDGSAVPPTVPPPATAATATTVVPAGASNLPSANIAPLVRETVPPTTVMPPAPMTSDARGLAFRVGEKPVAPLASDAEAVVAVSPETAETAEKPAPALPDRATLEAVVALLAPLALAIAPEQPTVALGAQPETATSESDPLARDAESTAVAIAVRAPIATTRGAEISVTVPGRRSIVLDVALAPTKPDATSVEEAPEFSTQTIADAPATPSPVPAIAVRVPTPPTGERAANHQATPGVKLEAAPAETSTQARTLEASASVELPGGAVVALALPKALAPIVAGVRANPGAVATALAAPVQTEKSAAPAAEKNPVNFASRTAAVKNFLSTTEQQLSPTREEAGIGVAETRPTMLFTPHDTLTAAHPTVPALVSMVPAASQVAAGAPAAEPMPPLVAASLAHRAVETVTSVVDAQAASKLQPVPSVQLKFKVGTEDLAVRIALRDGVVHTEFRTDSPELRAAIQQEWKAVTAQPESALRFLEPIVAPASSSQSGTNSFAQQQHQHSPGQSAAQQQQQHQQQQSRAAAEVFGSVGRATPFQPRDGGAASNVAPIALPTSVHLSAVA